MFDGLFENSTSEPRTQTRFGYLTEAEYEDAEARYTRKLMRVINCSLCDDDGYRGRTVCDHIDRTKTAREGMKKCRRVLSKIKPVNGIEDGL